MLKNSDDRMGNSVSGDYSSADKMSSNIFKKRLRFSKINDEVEKIIYEILCKDSGREASGTQTIETPVEESSSSASVQSLGQSGGNDDAGFGWPSEKDLNRLWGETYRKSPQILEIDEEKIGIGRDAGL